MAIFTPGPLIGAISGNLGGMNIANTRHGLVARKLPSRTDKKTEAQLRHRARWSKLTRTWNELTPAIRKEWRSGAKLMTYTNRLGITRPMSGFQFFLHHCGPFVNHDIYLTTRAAGPLPTFLCFNLTFTVTLPDTYEVDWELGWQDMYAFIHSARPYTTKPSTHVHHWKFAHLDTLPFPRPPVNIKDDFIALWGVPRVGEVVWAKVLVYQQLWYRPAPLMTASAVVT